MEKDTTTLNNDGSKDAKVTSQIPVTLIMDCQSERDKIDVVKWWRSMTASEMTDCIETKVILFYARPNDSNTTTSKE